MCYLRNLSVLSSLVVRVNQDTTVLITNCQTVLFDQLIYTNEDLTYCKSNYMFPDHVKYLVSHMHIFTTAHMLMETGSVSLVYVLYQLRLHNVHVPYP